MMQFIGWFSHYRKSASHVHWEWKTIEVPRILSLLAIERLAP